MFKKLFIIQMLRWFCPSRASWEAWHVNYIIKGTCFTVIYCLFFFCNPSSIFSLLIKTFHWLPVYFLQQAPHTPSCCCLTAPLFSSGKHTFSSKRHYCRCTNKKKIQKTAKCRAHSVGDKLNQPFVNKGLNIIMFGYSGQFLHNFSKLRKLAI